MKRPLKVLITSGGTRIPIDPVRDITNLSRGTFGAKIAAASLTSRHEVIYLCARDSATPFKITHDLHENLDWEGSLKRFASHYCFCELHKHRYHEVHFRYYDDYRTTLEEIVRTESPDVVVLAAAVSDYRVKNYSEAKLDSDANLYLEMEKTQKVISEVRGWHPNPKKMCLIGFKLLVNASDIELVNEAWASIQKNSCNYVVANDLRTLHSGQHEIIIVEPTWHFDAMGEPPIWKKYDHDLEGEIVKKINDWRDFLCDTSCLESQAV